jgi:hypothetical protein
MSYVYHPHSGGIVSSGPFVMTIWELSLATVINALFIGFSMYDVGSDLWAQQDLEQRLEFIKSFVRFRLEAPIVFPFIAFVVLCVPFVLYRLFKEDIIGIMNQKHKRHFTVHIVGIVNLICIVGILILSLIWILPVQQRFSSIDTSVPESLEMFPLILNIHIGQLLFNIFGLFLPFWRWYAIDKLATFKGK